MNEFDFSLSLHPRTRHSKSYTDSMSEIENVRDFLKRNVLKELLDKGYTPDTLEDEEDKIQQQLLKQLRNQKYEALHSIFPNSSPRQIALLIGSEYLEQYARQLSHELRAFYQEAANTDDSLIKINRRSAYRVFEFIPQLVNEPEVLDQITVRLSDEEIAKSSDFYLGTRSLLLNWSIGLGMTDVEEKFKRYRQFALLTQYRFDMIQRLCVLGKLPFPKPGFPWLLFETSAYINKANVCRQIPGKRQSYESKKRAIDELSNEEDEYGNACFESITDYLINAYSKIERIAKKTAKADKDFKDEFFSTYIKLKRRWNSKVLKDPHLKLIGTQPNRAGPKIGAKYCKT